MYPVQIETHPALQAMVMAYTGPYAQIAAAFGTMWQLLTAGGAVPEGAGAVIGLYYDDPATTPPDRTRAYLGVLADPGTALPAGMEWMVVEGGRFAVLTHTGAYAGLPAAWDWLDSVWLPASGERHAARAPFELYLNGPLTTPEVGLITQIRIPLA